MTVLWRACLVFTALFAVNVEAQNMGTSAFNRGARSAGRARAPRTPVLSQSDNYLYDRFLDLAVRQEETTIDGFLRILANTPDFRGALKAKTLVYKSGSGHGSSLEHPRALIMYGAGDLVVTFNGDPAHKLFNALEVMGYNNRKAEFEFREIRFRGETAREQQEVGKYDLENRYVQVRKAGNGCADCHGYVHPMPIWDTYLAWRGVYGSFEEHFELPKARFANSAKQTEATRLTEFLTRAPRLPRYQHFEWGRTLAESTFEINATLFGILLNYRIAHMANHQALKALNDPQKAKYKYAFAGALLDCNSSEFIPVPHGAVLNDTRRGLLPLMNELMSVRVAQELKYRQQIEADHEAFGDPLTWSNYGMVYLPFGIQLNREVVKSSDLRRRYSGLALGSAITARTEFIFKLARLDNLFKAIGVPPHLLALEGRTSWDGYNEIPEYMSEYLLQIYGLPSLVRENKVRAERGRPRNDLESPLLERDFQELLPLFQGLGLPMMPSGGGKSELCAALEAESQRALAN